MFTNLSAKRPQRPIIPK